MNPELNPSDTLTCQELVELVTAYLEGVMSPVEQARFEQHVAGCTGCQHYLAQMRQTVRLMGTLSSESLDATMQAQLLDVFRNWKHNHSS